MEFGTIILLLIISGFVAMGITALVKLGNEAGAERERVARVQAAEAQRDAEIQEAIAKHNEQMKDPMFAAHEEAECLESQRIMAEWRLNQQGPQHVYQVIAEQGFTPEQVLNSYDEIIKTVSAEQHMIFHVVKQKLLT